MKGLIIRERTFIWFMLYGVYLYFCFLSLRKASNALMPWINRSYTAIWLWIQKFANLANRVKVNRVSCILIDETQVQIGKDKAWVWLAFKPYKRAFLGFHISWNSLSAWLFLRRLRRKYGFKPIYTNGGLWYPLACKWARLENHRYGDEWKNFALILQLSPLGK